MKSAHVILALDTSASTAGVAVARGDLLLASDSVPAIGQQAEKLASQVEVVMNQAGVSFSDLSAVVCAVGPGPYTGLRVGVMTAQIIAAAVGVGACGISTHDLLAQQFYDQGESLQSSDLVVITQARRQQPAFSVYRGLSKITGPDIGTLADLSESLPLAIFVSTIDLGTNQDFALSWQPVLLNPEVIITYFVRANLGLPVAGSGLVEPVPIYLRPADAREPIDLRGKALRAALRG